MARQTDIIYNFSALKIWPSYLDQWWTGGYCCPGPNIYRHNYCCSRNTFAAPNCHPLCSALT